MNIILKVMVLGMFFLTANIGAFAEKIKIDPNLPNYDLVSGLGGNLSSVGSDTLNNLMTLWSEAFRKMYRNINIQIEGKGSATAPPALIEGIAQFGPMSRPMKKEEVNLFKKKYGFEPLPVGVALDALVVFVNRDNPTTDLSLKDLDGIFSSTYKSGAKNIEDWQKLITQPSWQKRPIRLYGRNSASGTYGYFKEHALAKGDFKNSVKERPGSAAVVQSVAEDKYGIGYSGMGYLTSNVKALSLSAKPSSQAVVANYKNVLNKKYPLSRLLYVYIVKGSKKPADRLTVEFLKFALSKQGQEIVLKSGYLPLSAALVKHALAKLQ